MFDDLKCCIFNKKQKLITEATKKEKLYHLECEKSAGVRVKQGRIRYSLALSLHGVPISWGSQNHAYTGSERIHATLTENLGIDVIDI